MGIANGFVGFFFRKGQVQFQSRCRWTMCKCIWKVLLLSMFRVAIICVYKLQATYTKSEMSFWTPSTVVFSQKPKGPYGDRKVDPEEEVPEEEQEEAGNLIKSSSWKLFLASPTLGVWCILTSSIWDRIKWAACLWLEMRRYFCGPSFKRGKGEM